VSNTTLLGGILLSPLLVIAFYRPWLGVIALFALQVALASGSTGITPIEAGYLLLFIATLCGWLFNQLAQKRFRLPQTPLIPVLVLFLAYCVFSAVFAILRNTPLLDWLRQWYTFAALILVLPIVTEFRQGKRLKILIGTFLVSSSLIAILGISNALGGGSLIQYASVGIPSTAYIWASILIISLLGYVRNIFWRICLLVLLAINLFRSVVDVSRLSVAAILLGLGAILWFSFIRMGVGSGVRRRYIKTAVLTMVAFVLVAVITVPELPARVIDLYSGRFSARSVQRGLINRYHRIQAAMEDWTMSPLVGQGFGYDFKQQQSRSTGGQVGPEHNLYVFLLSHSGIVGLGLYLLGLWWLLKEGWHAVNRSLGGFERGVAIGLFAACLSLMVFMMFSIRGSRIEAQVLLAMAGGTFILLNRKAKANRRRTRQTGALRCAEDDKKGEGV